MLLVCMHVSVFVTPEYVAESLTNDHTTDTPQPQSKPPELPHETRKFIQ